MTKVITFLKNGKNKHRFICSIKKRNFLNTLLLFIFISSATYAQIEPFEAMNDNKLETLKEEQCHTTLREYEHYKSLNKEQRIAYKKASENYQTELKNITKRLHSRKSRKASSLIIPLNSETDPEYTTIPEYTIPVVFHIVHDGDDDYILTEAQVKRAIKRVNEDFNGLSENRNTIQNQFKNDESRVGVRFVLAQKDPEGKPTNGITYGVHYRTFTTSQGEFHNMRTETKWPTNKYLNIWIINRNSTYDFVDGDSLEGGSGYAWLPEHDNGMSENGSATGITMAYWVLADRVENTPKHIPYRHILTHEVGHWLGLNHSWGSGYNNGDSAACNGDDGIEDTPNTIGHQRKKDFVNCDYTLSSCGEDTNVHEFMNYTPCTSMFTNGQKAAMVASLNSNTAGRDNVVSNANLEETLYVINQDAPRMVYSSDLGNGNRIFREERSSTTGAIATKTMIYLENGEFNSSLIGSNLTKGTHFSTVNVPNGLKAKINIIDANKAEFTFTGNATDHSNRSVKDVKLSFTNIAFDNLTATDIDHATDAAFDIVFRDANDGAPYAFLVDRGTLYNNSDGEEFGFYQRMRIPLNYGNSVLVFKFSNDQLYIRSNTESGSSGIVLTNNGAADGTDEVAILNKGDILNEQSNWSVYNRDHDLTKNWKKIISQNDSNINNYLGKNLYIGTYLTYDGQKFFRWIAFTLFKTEHGKLALKLLDSAFPNTPNTEIACGELYEDKKNPVNYLNTGYPFMYESIQNNGELHEKSFEFILRGKNSFKNTITASDYTVGVKNETGETINVLPAGVSISSVETLDDGKRLKFNLAGKLTNPDEEIATEISLKTSAYVDPSDTGNGITNPKKFTFLIVKEGFVGSNSFVDGKIDKNKTSLNLRGGNIKLEYKVDYTKATPETKIIIHSDSFGASVSFGSQFIADDATSNNVKILEEGTLLDQNANFTFPRDVNGSEQIIIHNKDYTKWEGQTGYIGYHYAVGRFRYYAWVKVKVGENGEYLQVLGEGVNTLTHTPILTGQNRDVITEYCEASNPSNSVYIKNVQLGDIDNNNTGHAPYSDHTDQSTDLVSGTDYTLTINTHNEHWPGNGIGVWIDWNNNFYFDDENELVYSKYGAGAYTATITVPDNVNSGTVRMRVRMTYGSENYIKPCGDSGDSNGRGEVEDYTINIIGTTTTSPISNFTADTTTVDEGSTVNFTDTSTNEPTMWAWSFEGGTPENSTVQNPSIIYNTPGVYKVTLTTQNSAGINTIEKEAFIEVKTVDTGNDDPVYCASSGTRIQYEWIAGVKVDDFNNPSEGKLYSDFTKTKIVPLNSGVSSEITLTPGHANTAYDDYFKVWIDYNQDGIFTQNEVAFDAGKGSKTAVTGTIDVPSSAKLGKTRMRVSMKYQNAPDSCGNIGDGEVEDYTVNITETTDNPDPIEYCESSGTRVQYEWIAGVKVDDFNNPSEGKVYSDFTTTKTVPLTAGASSEITLTPGHANTVYDEYFKVWIDYNLDGVFTKDEVVFDAGKGSKTAVTGTINVPSSAKIGKTRMRVSMKYQTAPNSCGNVGDGEVEDYTVDIKRARASKISKTELNNLITTYPNPAKENLTVELNELNSKDASIAIYDMLGREVQVLNTKKSSNTTNFNVSNLNAGTYIINVSKADKVYKKVFIKK